MFLLIENTGICPVEGFTILGLSTSRGTELIGQFGSGAKHGVLSCLRAGVIPEIWLGKDKLSFHTTDEMMGERPYKRVHYNWKGVNTPLSISLEFGAIDWTKLEYGMREFVSNALDAVGLVASKCRVELVPSIEPADGYTRVYLPAVPEVVKFYGNLKDHFLHFRGLETTSILEKDTLSKGRIYRKGVFVRETNSKSLFDYNIGGSIDECRNMSESAANSVVAELITNLTSRSAIRSYLSRLDQLKGTFEANLYAYQLEPPIMNRVLWRDEFHSLYPDALIWYASSSSGDIAQRAVAKGKHVILLPDSWFGMLSTCGIKSALTGLGYRTVGSRKIDEGAPLLVQNATMIWNWLLGSGLTAGKSMPAVKSFEEIMEGGTEAHGFYQADTVYILKGQESNLACILEEIGHHVTGAGDFSRDLQDWVFKTAVAWRKR